MSRVLFGAILFTFSYIIYVSSLKCWMCRNGAASFDLCDQKKEVQDCGNMLRCGTFSYIPKKNASRIYAKSCTTIDLCSANSSFCKNIGEQCRVQCCDTELCNFQKGFAPTSPPNLTSTAAMPSAPSTKPTTTTPVPPPVTTKQTTAKSRPLTTEKPTDKPTEQPSEMPVNPSKDSQSGIDEEDCSWVDAAPNSLTSSVLTISTCLILSAIFS